MSGYLELMLKAYCPRPLVPAAIFILLAGAVFCKEPKNANPALTIEEAKFQMVQLYLAQENPMPKLRTKYPELRAADKASLAAGRELREAAQAHPQLKERFEAIADSEASIPEKMKLWQPLFAEAEKIADLKDFQRKYDHARVGALKAEMEAIRKEGFVELAQKMKDILAQVEGQEKK
ncbi:MAG: hypothetical protein ACSHYB_15335 [Roseibacillus sp.]